MKKKKVNDLIPNDSKTLASESNAKKESIRLIMTKEVNKRKVCARSSQPSPKRLNQGKVFARDKASFRNISCVSPAVFPSFTPNLMS